MAALVAGLGLGFSLIVAIGAQNVFVLRQGIRRDHVWLVVVLCAASDAVLIALGVSGVGAATQAWPLLLPAVRWAGAAFLIGYGLWAAGRALRGPAGGLAIADPAPGAAGPAGRIALTCLALTWLNPHVYLDTVFLLGSVAATHGADRWAFAAGAALASVAWFSGLGHGARFLGHWLASPRSWRLLDALIAVVMVALGVSLVA